MRHVFSRLVAGVSAFYSIACDGGVGPSGLTSWKALSVREAQVCAITFDNETYCRGDMFNRFVGLYPWRATRLTRMEDGDGLVSLAGGYGFVCGLDAAGLARCVGLNHLGQLGAGPGPSRGSFAEVPGGYRWRRLTAGAAHACGITLEGETLCWGNAFRGALGNGDLTGGAAHLPNPVMGAHEFIELAAGGAFTCGIDTTGAAWCWGADDSGQLGEGASSTTDQAVPVAVASSERFTALAAGESFVCALAGRTPYCWGRNAGGQLGIGTRESSHVPARVQTSEQIAQFTAGRDYVCAVTTASDLLCWGGNWHGQFGDGTREPSDLPRRIGGFHRFEQVQAGFASTCGLTRLTRQAFCWGLKFDRTIFEERLVPVPMGQ